MHDLPDHDSALFDTSVVISLGRIDATGLPRRHSISAITLAELEAGPLMTSTVDEQSTRQALLQRAEALYRTIPFDLAAVRAYGQISGAVAAIGRKPRGQRALDLLIAATALANGLPLYTRNPDDFAGLEELLEIVAV